MMPPTSLSATSVFILLSSLSTTCLQFAQSFSVPSNRIFVAGISQTCTEQTISSTFSQFGSIEDILIIGQDDATNAKKKKRVPFCFVTFDDVSSAEQAISASSLSSSSSSLYKEVQYAKPKDDNRRRSNQARTKEAEKRAKVESFGEETNLIVQVQSTHVDRLMEYLQRRNENGPSNNNLCSVLGSTNANGRNVSLLFLSCANNPIGFARILSVDPILARAINKLYIVQSGLLLEGNLATERGCDQFSKVMFDEVSSSCTQKDSDESEPTAVLRVQVYPPKYQSPLLQNFESILYENNASQQFAIAPKGFTHMISIVEVYQYKGRSWEEKQYDDNSKLYMMGISPASMELDVVDTNNIIAEDGSGDGDDVSRAYYKLKEALETYQASSSSSSSSSSTAGRRRNTLQKDLYDNSIALDCGSAPGGWTKYLIEHFRCSKVYSIDPGSLSPSVESMKETVHMRMKVQDALPLLLGDDETVSAAGRVKLWVSDMCLHDMGEQVDLLLLAKKEGLLAPNAFFVLTLKCVLGHSKLAYDAQVEEVVDKNGLRAPENGVEGLEIFHLFSNRSGERTVIGYIR